MTLVEDIKANGFTAVVKVTGASYREVVQRLEDLAARLADGQDATSRENVGPHHIAVVGPTDWAPVVTWKDEQ